ncbi:vesicle-trafficking protein SEC22c isoform X2 [Zootoca vivipara]|uniref:vesicle-trafficking protein SEC22c isoform X2 n=1 Tax=Zootoca vivipara TaxID=8524 RepID=UPI00293BC77F|nr:vesicle-trafficking protein SEC22c isoform X2 [Zootoca vivipara]
MSMILFACVVRVRDGLPLSASTDFHLDQDFLECRKRLKTLSSILTQYPERGTAKECDLSIHFHSSGDVACMGICTSSFPAAMAFCFLEELQWEFATTYDATSVGLASRPYAFLEFDNVIQKVKGRFNYTNCAQTKFNLEKIQEELLLRPPALVKLEDAELRNGIVNGHTELCMESAPAHRMQPVSALGILSLVLNIMCGALNLIRGVHLAEYSFQGTNCGINFQDSNETGRLWGCGAHLALLAEGAGIQLPGHVASMTRPLLANQSSTRKDCLPSCCSGTYLSTCTLTCFQTANEQRELTPSQGFEPPT